MRGNLFVPSPLYSNRKRFLVGAMIELISKTEEILANEATIQTFHLTGITQEADHILQAAFEEAQRYQHDTIGAEHVLLALLKESEDKLKAVLQQSGLKEETVHTVLLYLHH